MLRRIWSWLQDKLGIGLEDDVSWLLDAILTRYPFHKFSFKFITTRVDGQEHLSGVRCTLFSDGTMYYGYSYCNGDAGDAWSFSAGIQLAAVRCMLAMATGYEQKFVNSERVQWTRRPVFVPGEGVPV